MGPGTLAPPVPPEHLGGEPVHVLHDWFGYPDGAVLTNLVASAICVGFGVWKLIGHLNRVHRRLDSLHEKQDRLHKHLDVPPK